MSNKKTNNKAVVIFEDKPVRRVWLKKEEKWYFAVADIIAILAESSNPADYIKKMRKRDEELSKGWGQIVTPLVIETKGGPQKANCANVEGILRIIQSIPSKKVEPIKLWLAKVGYERIEDINDSEKALNRSRNYWQRMGRNQKWIQQRMMGQEIRNTDAGSIVAIALWNPSAGRSLFI